MKSLQTFILACAITSFPITANAGTCRKPLAAGENPHYKGTKHLVFGIVTTAATVPVSILTGYAVGEAQSSCKQNPSSDEKRCRNEQRGWNTGLAVAGVMSAVGLSTGILLIRKGKKHRRQFYEWEDNCRGNEVSFRRYRSQLHFDSLRLEAADKPGSSKLSFNFQF